MLNPQECGAIPFSPNYSYYFDFEKNFDTEKRRVEMNRYWYLPYLFSALYVVTIFAGRELMKTRKPYRLQSILIVWNLALCIFSLIGALRVLPEFLHVYSEYGFAFSVCDHSGFVHNRVCASWNYLFTLSKVFELVDTLFVVLRKQNLIFLHWFHHAATLIVTWHGFMELISLSRWYISMNFVVHFVMYGYYAARAARYQVPKWVAMPITMAQIVQMVIGTFVSAYALGSLLMGRHCDISTQLCSTFVALYCFFFFLFIKFFLVNYFSKKALPTNKHVAKTD